MKQQHDSGSARKPRDLTELQQHVELLERDIRRLQLEHDLLKKANELLKKGLATLNFAKLELLSPQTDNLDDWNAQAEQSSPQIQSLKAQLEITRQELAKAQSGHHPTLDAVAQWQQSESESVTNKSVSLQLNIPLFAGGYVNASVRQALASLEYAEHTLEAGRHDLRLRVHKEFRGVTENIPRIKALEQALRTADQLVLSSRKSFQAGSRTVIDILNAEQQRVKVLRDLAQARYVYLISKIRLLALVGGADMDAVVALNSVLQN